PSFLCVFASWREFLLAFRLRVSKRDPESAAHPVGIVAIAAQLAVVTDIGRYRPGPVHAHPGIDDRAVVAETRTEESDRGTGYINQAGRYRKGALIEIVLPGGSYKRPDANSSNLKFVPCSKA